MPNKIPGTLQRSPPKAQRTYSETLKNAEREYGSGERASRTAYAALKHGFEKVGDHWEEKAASGPSDSRSRQPTAAAKRAGKGKTFGGVDVEGHTRDELYARARALGIPVNKGMTKEDLGSLISKKQD